MLKINVLFICTIVFFILFCIILYFILDGCHSKGKSHKKEWELFFCVFFERINSLENG